MLTLIDYKKLIEEDITNGEPIEIVELNDNYITIIDETEVYREITFYNPLSINTNWIKNKTIITPSADNCEYKIDIEKISNWISKYIEPDFLSILNTIIFLGDNDEDYSYLRNYSNEFYCELQESDLPYDEVMGLSWWSFNKVFIHLGNIHKTVDELIDEGIFEADEKEKEINYGILTTLAHELRHLAQSNPYLPDSILQQRSDDETDAEDYARNLCDRHFECVTLR